MTNRLVGVLVANRMYQEYQTDSITMQPIFQPERNQVFRDRYFSQMVGPELFMLATYITENEIRFVSKRLYKASKKNEEKLTLKAYWAFEQTVEIHSNTYFKRLKSDRVSEKIYRYRLSGSLKSLASSYLLRTDLMKELAEEMDGDLMIAMPSPELLLMTRNAGELQGDFAQLAATFQRKEKYGEWGTKNLFVFRKEKGVIYRVFYDRVVSEGVTSHLSR